MSVLLIEIVPQGVIFGADRNITHSIEKNRGLVIEIRGQSQRAKVLRWPNRKALVGYIGAAEIGGLPTDEWLYDFIGEHLTFGSLETLARTISKELQEQRYLDERGGAAERLIVHLAGFEKKRRCNCSICLASPQYSWTWSE